MTRLASALALVVVFAAGGCGSDSSAGGVASSSATASDAIPAAVLSTCEAFFNATRVRDDAGVTITPSDEAALDKALGEAIDAARQGGSAIPILGQVAEELETMRSELRRPQPDTYLMGRASGLVTRVCLEDYMVPLPEWARSR